MSTDTHKKGFIYAIKRISNETEYKLGRTKDVKKRLVTLQTGNSEILRAAYYIQVEDMVKAERMLHTIFGAYRKKGEWFSLPVHEELLLKKIFGAINTSDEEQQQFERLGLR